MLPFVWVLLGYHIFRILSEVYVRHEGCERPTKFPMLLQGNVYVVITYGVLFFSIHNFTASVLAALLGDSDVAGVEVRFCAFFTIGLFHALAHLGFFP